jgi:hypothetical protein
MQSVIAINQSETGGREGSTVDRRTTDTVEQGIDSHALKLECELHFEISQSGLALRPLLTVAIKDAERTSNMMRRALKKATCATVE